MNIVPEIKSPDNKIQEVREVKRGVCQHPRHRTVIKGKVWRCRKCGVIRVLGVNSIQDEGQQK